MKKLFLLISILVLSCLLSPDASARYKGDLNGDDRVDLADMVYLAKAIKSGSTDKELDVNASGKVDDNDLQRLADIIISGNLTTETGLNVGIGDWDDAGEDFGGTVKAPAYTTRSYEDTRLYLRDPKLEYDDIHSIEFGISEGEMNPYAILVSVAMPVDGLNPNKQVSLSESVMRTHKIYGTPKMIEQRVNDDWTPLCIRFIIFSPDLEKMNMDEGKIGRLYYSMQPSPYAYSSYFINSQIIGGYDMRCVDLPYHDSGYYGHLDVGVKGISNDNAPCDVYSPSGTLLKRSVPVSELQNLDHGIYIIRQGNKTTKLLK